MSPTSPHCRELIFIFLPSLFKSSRIWNEPSSSRRPSRRWLGSPLFAAAPPSLHPITMAERRSAAPGLSHLLPQDFFSDSIRELCRYLLLSLLHWPSWAGIRRPFPVHLLTTHRPTPRKSGRYFPPETTVPENPFLSITQWKSTKA